MRFPVYFASVFGRDGNGFVKTGHIEISDDEVRLSGRRYRPSGCAATVLVWLLLSIAMSVVLASILGSIAWGISKALLPLNSLNYQLGLMAREVAEAFACIASYVLAYFAVTNVGLFTKAASLHLNRGDLSEIMRTGRSITFAGLQGKGSRRTLFHARTVGDARTIERALKSLT